MQRYMITYGQTSGRGGWLIKAMDYIDAPSEDVAYAKAEYIANKYRDRVLCVELSAAQTYV